VTPTGLEVEIPNDDAADKERRCIVTGERLPEEGRIRFVVGPDGAVCPDIEGRLPGRGMWVKADRTVLAEAVAKNRFSKAAKEPVKAGPDLPDLVETLLVRRMLGDLGLGRKSGTLVFGFDNVVRALMDARPPGLLIQASDGAPDGKRKLKNAARAEGVEPAFVECLSSGELALALGRENVIHAAVRPGRLADRLVVEASRLEGFRPRNRRAGGSPEKDRNERDE
jgi:predicted RNA-binding protein YlxR (DUF448 family)